MLEFRDQQDKDRKYYTAKIKEAESRGSGSGAKYQDLMMQYAKDQAQWESEKGMLVRAKDDVTEQNERLTKKLEQLTKENEKYKHDLKANKRNMY